MQDKAYEVIRDHQGKHWWFRGRARIAQTVLLRDLDLNNGDILDVGAGFGGMVPLLKTLGTVEALEPYEDARKALEETGALVRIEGIESFLAGRKDCYDLITLFDVLEHIEDDRGTVAGIRRALKPGGRLVLTVPAMPVLWSAHDELHNHFRRYTRKGLRSILGDCFEIERLGYYNSLLWPLAFLERKLTRLCAGEKSTDVERSSGVLNGLLYRIFIAEIPLLRMGISFPFGVSLMARCRKAVE